MEGMLQDMRRARDGMMVASILNDIVLQDVNPQTTTVADALRRLEPRWLLEVFVSACSAGHTHTVRALVESHDALRSDAFLRQGGFHAAADAGHWPLAQELFRNGHVDVHWGHEDVFRLACRSGRLDMAQWLFDMGGVDVYVCCNESFRSACFCGHLSVAQWLFDVGGRAVLGDAPEENMRIACIDGRLEVVQWLSTLLTVADLDKFWAVIAPSALEDACRAGHAAVAQWMLARHTFDVRALCDTLLPILSEKRKHLHYCLRERTFQEGDWHNDEVRYDATHANLVNCDAVIKLLYSVEPQTVEEVACPMERAVATPAA
jgi:hypothetical protein